MDNGKSLNIVKTIPFILGDWVTVAESMQLCSFFCVQGLGNIGMKTILQFAFLSILFSCFIMCLVVF
jgi:hypothetical protein